ncbi:MAG: hypothetical protein HYV14_13895 [Elusimicrobia bacterium]|nr:hypothetical protein [Elusimicrobiota bacterium]
MKNLHRLFAVILSLGMLGAAACSGCSQQPEETSSTSLSQPMSYKCGAGTHRVGNQCIGDTESSSSSKPATTLKTTGNN